MIDYELALETVLLQSYRLNSVRVPISDSIGKIIAENIVASSNIPPFDKSKVDGFAVNSEDVKDEKAVLEVKGEISSGSVPVFSLERGQAGLLMAGAPVPDGSDTVQRMGNTRSLADGERVGMLSPAIKSENIVFEGELVKKDQMVLEPGTLIRSTEICLMSLLGRKDVEIFQPARVSVVSIGNELLETGENPQPGKFWDGNGIALNAALYEIGAQPEYLGIIPQNPDMIKKSILQSNNSNMLIMAGGTTYYGHQIMMDLFRELNIDILIDGIAMKPGSSCILARYDKTLIFVLPQNPFSVMVVFETLIYPAILKMMGFNNLHRFTSQALIESTFKKKLDYHIFQPAWIHLKNDALYVKPIIGFGEASILSLSKCNALMSIPKDVNRIKKGKNVEVVFTNLTNFR